MELIPADLGARRSLELFQMRALAQLTQGQSRGGRLRGVITSQARSNVLTRFWAKESGLAPEIAETAIQAVQGQLLGLFFGLGGGLGLSMAMQTAIVGTVAHQPVIAALLGVSSLGGFFLGGRIPLNYVRRWGKTPLNDQELEQLLSQEEDELERSYLMLIREAFRLSHLPEAAKKELKEAIKILGMALDRLPPAPAETAHRNTTSLRSEAADLRTQALQEQDRVAGESLERRADALERSATAMEKSATLLRRNSLLRQELQAQLEALRLELTSTSATGTDASSLAQVAQVARGVAREADALATARAEIDTPQVQRVGIG